jgi:phosphoribosylaminoimidazolecarboxamide formyltransferase / IMP cyclohydrolase
MADFIDDDPTAAIFKHTVPCGVATAGDLKTAYNERLPQTKFLLLAEL